MEKWKRFSSTALRNKYIELMNKCKATTMEYNKTIVERLIDSNKLGQFYIIMLIENYPAKVVLVP